MSDDNYKAPDLTLLGEDHIKAYRDTDGETGYLWNGVPTLLLTATGRRSGEPRTTALIFATDGDDHLVVASMGGAPEHPQWYRNVTANPRAEIQVKGDHIPVVARTATPDEKPRLWDIVRGVWPNYDVYQSRTDRDIPVVVLSRAPTMMGDGAFDGVRVVELAQWVFVPVAGALLADWGADVVRVDRPEGDPYRGLATQGIGTDSGDVKLSIALANRGKRSIALDLHTEDGQRILHQLLETADVFLTSFRPDALVRLGLDADALRERYPSLIYARGNGYGMRGPDAGMAGYDASAYWARGGIAHVLTPADRDYPVTPRGAMGDRNGAMALAFGIAGALLKRTNTGVGSIVDVSLLGTAMWTASSDVLAALQGAEPRAAGGRGPVINPLVGTYRTSDGRHISLVFLQSDRYWAPLCDLVDRPDIRDDPRFVDHASRDVNRAECVAALDEVFASRTYQEWKELLRKLDAPWAPVQAIEELLTDPQVLANDYLGQVSIDGGPTYQLPTVPVQFDEQPPELRPAPEHGEQTEAILLELGYDWDDIIRFKDATVIP